MKETLTEIIDVIARERCIEEQVVKNILKESIRKFAVGKYGHEDLIKCEIFSNGSFEIFIEQEVVQRNYDDRFDLIELELAKARKKDVEIGDMVRETLPFTITKAELKSMLYDLQTSLNTSQKEKEYEIFSDKIGTIVTGYIKRSDSHEAIVSFSDGEGVLKKNKTLPNDNLKSSSYVKMYIENVRKSENRQILLSRTHTNFLRELMKQEIPEIKEGLIEIKAIARDPGSLSKVAVHSTISSINPVKLCIGEFGIRVKAITKELAGEKIHIVLWNENINQFIANALAPARILKVIEKKDNRFYAVTDNEDFNKAMGRNAQNVMLARKLCKVQSITLMTEAEEAEKNSRTLTENIELLTQQLEIEQMMAHLLISEDFDSVEIIANSEVEEIAKLNGFDDELALILIQRAQNFIEKESQSIKTKLANINKNDSLFQTSLSNKHIEKLMQNNIFEKEDLAMLDANELVEIFKQDEQLQLSFDQACIVISEARNIQRRNND